MELRRLLESRGLGRSYNDIQKSIERGETTIEKIHAAFCKEELALVIDYAVRLIARGIENQEAISIANHAFNHVARADIEAGLALR